MRSVRVQQQGASDAPTRSRVSHRTGSRAHGRATDTGGIARTRVLHASWRANPTRHRRSRARSTPTVQPKKGKGGGLGRPLVRARASTLRHRRIQLTSPMRTGGISAAPHSSARCDGDDSPAAGGEKVTPPAVRRAAAPAPPTPRATAPPAVAMRLELR